MSEGSFSTAFHVTDERLRLSYRPGELDSGQAGFDTGTTHSLSDVSCQVPSWPIHPLSTYLFGILSVNYNTTQKRSSSVSANLMGYVPTSIPFSCYNEVTTTRGEC